MILIANCEIKSFRIIITLALRLYEIAYNPLKFIKLLLIFLRRIF